MEFFEASLWTLSFLPFLILVLFRILKTFKPIGLMDALGIFLLNSLNVIRFLIISYYMGETLFCCSTCGLAVAFWLRIRAEAGAIVALVLKIFSPRFSRKILAKILGFTFDRSR